MTNDTRQSPSVPIRTAGSPRSPQRDGSAHTPGPWRLDSMGLSVYATNPYRHGDMRVLDVRGWGHLTGAGACRLPEDDAIAIQKANGALAAAAPDLLAALKALTQDSRFNLAIGGNPNAIDALVKQVDEAIAKAEGR